MLESVNFTYDGIKSVDMGLINVKIGGGMFEENFLPSRDIEEKVVNGRDKPYFKRVRHSPLEFELTFAFEHYYDEQKIREVARWLNQDYYKPFFTNDNPSRIFYCMVVDDSRLIHTGLKQGYITLTMRCDSPYSYTPHYNKDNLLFGSTKITKSLEEDTFNNEMGTQSNVSIDEDGNMYIDGSDLKWSELSGMKWSDL